MLEAETQERIREIFAGKVCTGCGAPAERVSYGDKFWCGRCYRNDDKPLEVRKVKDPGVWR